VAPELDYFHDHHANRYPQRKLAQCSRTDAGGVYFQYHRVRARGPAQRYRRKLRYVHRTCGADADGIRLDRRAGLAAADAADAQYRAAQAADLVVPAIYRQPSAFRGRLEL